MCRGHYPIHWSEADKLGNMLYTKFLELRSVDILRRDSYFLIVVLQPSSSMQHIADGGQIEAVIQV